MGREKRTAQRKRHNSAIEIFDEGWNLIGLGRLVDYSSVGISFAASEELVPHEKVHARLRLFDKGIKEIEGRVVWRRQDRNMTIYGVKFEKVKDVNR